MVFFFDQISLLSGSLKMPGLISGHGGKNLTSWHQTSGKDRWTTGGFFHSFWNL